MRVLKFFAALFALASSIAPGYSLTIDNQLVIIANDCYTRIAIGSILPSKEIAARVTASTVTECEDECSRKRSTCEIFSFGISSKGNASCLLGTRVPNPEELVANSDYDIYIRQQSSPDCMPDRLYKLGSGDRRNPSDLNGDKTAGKEGEKKRGNETFDQRRPKPGKRPINQNIIPGPGGFGTLLINQPSADRVISNVLNIANTENEGNNYQNFNPSYQPSADSNSGYPTFDQDNPNGPYNYGENNHHDIGQIGGAGYGPNIGIAGNQNFENGHHPENGGDFYSEHQYGDGNNDDYYFHNLDPGNRYGINGHETPETVCKQRVDDFLG